VHPAVRADAAIDAATVCKLYARPLTMSVAMQPMKPFPERRADGRLFIGCSETPPM